MSDRLRPKKQRSERKRKARLQPKPQETPRARKTAAKGNRASGAKRERTEAQRAYDERRKRGLDPKRDVLTQQQRVYAETWMKNGGRKADAYRAAYDCSGMTDASIYVLAHRVHSMRAVELYIEEMQARATEEAVITKRDVLLGLKAIAQTSLPDVVEWDGERLTVRPFAELTAAQAAALKSVRLTEVENQTEKKDGTVSTSIVRRVDVELWDKNAAWDKLMRHLGMYRQLAEMDEIHYTIVLSDGTELKR